LRQALQSGKREIIVSGLLRFARNDDLNAYLFKKMLCNTVPFRCCGYADINTYLNEVRVTIKHRSTPMIV